MNDLKGKHVNIVLSITEGRGFDILHCPFCITANYSGRTMQSNMMEPQSRVLFDTEMVWETDKKQLRKARCAYTAIRLECYTTDRKSIGFAMVRLRSAKIIAQSSTDQEPAYIWMKLLNVPNEWKKGALQVNLSLTIRDTFPETESPRESEKPLQPALQPTHINMPIKCIADGYIQLGPDSDTLEKFQIKLTSQVASNLDSLLSEDMVFCQGDQMYYLMFNIFDMHIKTRRFSRDLHESLTINETVVINLVSTLDMLSSYFKQVPNVVVQFYSNEHILGTSRINLWQLTNKMNKKPSNLMQTKFSIEEEIVFKSDKAPDEATKRIPTLKTISTIEILEKEITAESNMESTVKETTDVWNSDVDKPESSKSSHIEELSKSLFSGEINCDNKSSKPYKGIPVFSERVKMEFIRRVKEFTNIGESTVNVDFSKGNTKSDPPATSRSKFFKRNRVLKHPLLLNRIDEISESSISLVSNDESAEELGDYSDQSDIGSSDSYQLFRLDVIVEAIIWNQEPGCEQVALHFLHPKGKGQLQIYADITNMVAKRIVLKNVICKYFYMSTPLRISQVVGQYMPVIEARNGETGELLGNPLFVDSLDFCTTMRAQNCLIPLLAIDLSLEIAQFNISAFLEECEMPIHANLEEDLLPEIVDDAIIARSLEEHETWMRKERQMFALSLEQSLKKKMKDLRDNYREQQDELDQAWGEEMQRAKEIAVELKTTISQMCVDCAKKRRIITDDYDIYLEIYKNIIRYGISDKNELIEKISELRLDNTILRDMLTEQHLELKDMRKTRLTPEQIKTLLTDLRTMESKYEEVTKDKKYFQKEFEKAVQEVHTLKVERHNNIQRKIADDKRSFAKLRMEAFVASIQPLLHRDFAEPQQQEENSDEEEFQEVPKEFEVESVDAVNEDP